MSACASASACACADACVGKRVRVWVSVCECLYVSTMCVAGTDTSGLVLTLAEHLHHPDLANALNHECCGLESAHLL